MSNQQNFPDFSFVGLGDWEPFEGGAHGMVPREGLYHVKVMELEPVSSKNPQMPMAKIQTVIQDADAPGIGLIDRVIYAGQDSKGKPMARQFAEFMHSAGTPKENIKQQGAAGTKMPINQLLGMFKGRDAYVDVVYKTYQGQPACEIRNWVSKERYLKAKENGGHRGRAQEQVNWALLQQQEAAANAGAQGGGAGPAGGFGIGAAQPGVSAPSFGGGVNLGGPQGFAPPSANNAAAPSLPNL